VLVKERERWEMRIDVVDGVEKKGKRELDKRTGIFATTNDRHM